MLLFPFLTILLSYLSLFLFYFFLLLFLIIFYVPSCLNILYCSIFFHPFFFQFFVFFLHPPHFRTFHHSFNRHTYAHSRTNTHTHTHNHHHYVHRLKFVKICFLLISLLSFFYHHLFAHLLYLLGLIHTSLFILSLLFSVPYLCTSFCYVCISGIILQCI